MKEGGVITVNPNESALENFLLGLSSTLLILDEEGSRTAWQRWREVFAAPVLRATGKWTYKSSDWHAFSHRFSNCVRGARAEHEFSKIEDRYFFAFSSLDCGLAYRCSGLFEVGRIAFADLVNGDVPLPDVFVSSLDMDWTMVFTHEDSSGTVGPFFSRREWQMHDQPETEV